MEESGCKCPISWKWGCKEDILLLFVKILMPFGSLKLHIKLLESVSLIIIFCWKKTSRRRVICVLSLKQNDTSTKTLKIRAFNLLLLKINSVFFLLIVTHGVLN